MFAVAFYMCEPEQRKCKRTVNKLSCHVSMVKVEAKMASSPILECLNARACLSVLAFAFLSSCAPALIAYHIYFC